MRQEISYHLMQVVIAIMNLDKLPNSTFFIKNELMPYISKNIKKQKTKVFIGHSFGGLLALYFSLKAFGCVPL